MGLNHAPQLANNSCAKEDSPPDVSSPLLEAYNWREGHGLRITLFSSE